MADQDTMRLVAEVVDKFSGPLKEMQKAMRETRDTLKDSHADSLKAARLHHKEVRELQERFTKAREVIAESFTPALATVGITAFGVGEVIGTLAEKVKAASEQYNAFNETIKRGHVSANYANTLENVFIRMGSSAEQAHVTMREFGQTIDRLKRPGNNTELQRIESQLQGAAPWFARAIKDAKNYEEALTSVIKVLSDTHIDPDLKLKLAEIFHLPKEAALKDGHEWGEAFKKSAEEASKHPIDVHLLQKLDDAYTELRITQKNFWTDFVRYLGDDGPHAIEMFTHAVDKMAKLFAGELKADLKTLKDTIDELKAIWDWAPAEWMKKTPQELLEQFRKQKSDASQNPNAFEPNKYGTLTPAQKLAAGMSPISFGGSAGSNPLSTAVKEGVLEAFREWMALQSGGSAGGFTNASFNTGGSIGPAARFGGGGYINYGQSYGNRETTGGQGGANGGADIQTGTGAFIDRDKWRAQLDANPALKERFFRHALGENSGALANQAVMESAANRADIRGNRRFDEHGNLSYFQGYHRGPITAKMRKMLEDNYRKVFVEGSDVSHGAIDNSSGWLAAKHDRTGRFRATFRSNGETFQVPGTGESGSGERARYPAFRAEQLRRAAERAAAFKAKQDELQSGMSPQQHIDDSFNSLRQMMNDHDNAKRDKRSQNLGDASVKIALEGFPRGTRTSTSSSGIFKEVSLDRGRVMPVASMDS